MEKIIFLDNASTTPLCEDAKKGIEFAVNKYYNPSALYGEALSVKNEIENARAVIAKRLGASANEIFFTSCATESNNWVFESGFKNKKGNIVVSSMEHASVYQCAMRQKSRGADVRFVPLQSDGRIDIDKLYDLLDENTSLVSIIHCSNETGVINDLKAISSAIKSKCRNALFHSDGVQALCKTNNKVGELCVDMYSLSAHKIGGMKGIGALYIKKGVSLQPYIAGGGQEYGMRSGTENVAGILSFAAAVKNYENKFNAQRAQTLRNIFISVLSNCDVKINGTATGSNCILSLSIKGIKAEVLQHMLSDKGVLIGLGSACSSKSRNNRVLSAMGVSPKLIEGSIRISTGIDTTEQDATNAAEIIKQEIYTLRGNLS